MKLELQHDSYTAYNLKKWGMFESRFYIMLIETFQ